MLVFWHLGLKKDILERKERGEKEYKRKEGKLEIKGIKKDKGEREKKGSEGKGRVEREKRNGEKKGKGRKGG